MRGWEALVRRRREVVCQRAGGQRDHEDAQNQIEVRLAAEPDRRRPAVNGGARQEFSHDGENGD